MKERCPHEMALDTCVICRDVPEGRPPVVFITSGGAVYHHREDCPDLIEGQRWVERRGGKAGRIESVPIKRALGLGRDACGGCA